MKKIFVAMLLAGAVCSANSKIKCTADLPANNPWGLPVSWEIELDTDSETATLHYSGGPKDGVDADQVISNVLATEEYAGGYDIANFGYNVNNAPLRILLAYKEYTHKKAELRFRAKINRMHKGLRLLDSAPAFCQ